MSDTSKYKVTERNGIGRLIFTGLVFIGEIAFVIWGFQSLNSYAGWIDAMTRILAVALVLAIYSMNKTSSLKTPWIILMLASPILGVGLYLIVGLNVPTIRMRRRYERIDAALLPKLTEGKYGEQAKKNIEALRMTDPHLANIADYLTRKSGYPPYRNTDVVYYKDASEGIEAQKEEMRKAKSFIFLEYHAIEAGESWYELEEILKEKVRQGVEVRVFYDDAGSIGFVNMDFAKRLRASGIRCRVFNPFMPGLNMFLNNRDHRKITVIDGVVGFTGGYNLADEYFNVKSPYGLWKDTGIKITGEAVRNLTVAFLENWNAVKSGDEDDMNVEKYLPETEYSAGENGIVQPYADTPLDKEQVGEETYISMINAATEYCYFVTPYLILTDEMIHAIGLAAKRGVDVRIITPGIPDKRVVYSLTRSYYRSLVRNGVRIYEWSPGFCHCKMCIIDDKAAICGTINLDYRSLYHHFENSCLYVGCKAVADTKRDFETMFEQSTEVTEKYTSGRYSFLRLGHLILRLFAPLL